MSAVPSVGWCVGLVWFIDCGATLSVAWITGCRLVLVLLPIVRFCVWCLGCFDVLILGFVGCWFCRVGMWLWFWLGCVGLGFGWFSVFLLCCDVVLLLALLSGVRLWWFLDVVGLRWFWFVLWCWFVALLAGCFCGIVSGVCGWDVWLWWFYVWWVLVVLLFGDLGLCWWLCCYGLGYFVVDGDMVGVLSCLGWCWYWLRL